MTDQYNKQAIFARRIAGEIAEVATNYVQVKMIISEIERQFDYSTPTLPDCAIGRAGHEIEMPRTEDRGGEN